MRRLIKSANAAMEKRYLAATACAALVATSCPACRRPGSQRPQPAARRVHAATVPLIASLVASPPPSPPSPPSTPPPSVPPPARAAPRPRWRSLPSASAVMHRPPPGITGAVRDVVTQRRVLHGLRPTDSPTGSPINRLPPSIPPPPAAMLRLDSIRTKCAAAAAIAEPVAGSPAGSVPDDTPAAEDYTPRATAASLAEAAAKEAVAPSVAPPAAFKQALDSTRDATPPPMPGVGSIRLLPPTLMARKASITAPGGHVPMHIPQNAVVSSERGSGPSGSGRLRPPPVLPGSPKARMANWVNVRAAVKNTAPPAEWINAADDDGADGGADARAEFSARQARFAQLKSERRPPPLPPPSARWSSTLDIATKLQPPPAEVGLRRAVAAPAAAAMRRRRLVGAAAVGRLLRQRCWCGGGRPAQLARSRRCWRPKVLTRSDSR